MNVYIKDIKKTHVSEISISFHIFSELFNRCLRAINGNFSTATVLFQIKRETD